MPTDPLTPDELVRLAVYCGWVEIDIEESGVWIWRTDGGRELWQPQLDAMQRDELVEAVGDADVNIHVTRDWVKVTIIRRMESIGAAVVLTRDEPCLSKRIGEAVCRAALEVIGEHNAD